MKFEVIKGLVELGNDVNLHIEEFQLTPLYKALQIPNISPQIIKYMLQKGADPNYTNGDCDKSLGMYLDAK